jgi:hypothetical protein
MAVRVSYCATHSLCEKWLSTGKVCFLCDMMIRGFNCGILHQYAIAVSASWQEFWAMMLFFQSNALTQKSVLCHMIKFIFVLAIHISFCSNPCLIYFYGTCYSIKLYSQSNINCTEQQKYALHIYSWILSRRDLVFTAYYVWLFSTLF